MVTSQTIIDKFSSIVVVSDVSEFICRPTEPTEKESLFSIKGLFGSAKAYFLSAVVGKCVKAQIHLIIEDSKEAAEYMCGDLYNIFPGEVYYFPSSSSMSSKIVSIKDSSNKVLRSIALTAINNFSKESSNVAIVTYPEAVKEKILNSKDVINSILKIEVGQQVDYENLKEVLQKESFERVDFVAEPGQFAIRGGIIDIFSYSDNVPYRIDFFGNTVESIKKFNVNTQRSDKSVESVEIFPDIYNPSNIMAHGGQSLLQYVSNENCVVWNNTFESVSEVESGKKIVYINGKTIYAASEEQKIKVANLDCSPQPSFNKNFALLADDIRKKNSRGFQVFISSSSKDQIERIKNIFRDSSHIVSEGEYPYFNSIEYSNHQGFICNDAKICIYTDHQIFERYHRVKIRREVERSERLALADLNAFHIGDYIVHIDHGVGIFGGLLKTNIGGKLQEAVKITYRDGDVIFVSVHGLHKISKYKSKDGLPPKIYKLGGNAWNKLKATTKARIKDIAEELINLYAERKQARGFAFSEDNYMQHALEASFVFEDTPDQLSATKAVKHDMESSSPMDRLICGDVGFGKTEIAIRAAFKAVCDNKQVCVLVPTTILALQHYKTFTERLAKFPCRIDYLSRLRITKDIKEIIKNLADGKIDIIIGTHRLLNKQIKFKDLGLLIIDEEQKFGVSAKERLRQLKVEVDTLTLTATPIPRTLQFSLLGARDLSIINTPPPNRLPVQTEIIDFNEEYIREAIEYELNRGGQVFFVHNRVEDILAVEQMINRLSPKAKTITGHGQMEATELENRILGFIRGDSDVLISTTIIENGIDIPNANTMIINQAHMFGLSDLHQLRGRVGRSGIKAYCYLIIPPMTSISEDAKRRIKAIEAFSELGSGFNIAMQDLDIRGAGNLLGGEQSGFIADMGFETYQKILNEAFIEINAKRQDVMQEVPEDMIFVSDCSIDTDLEIYIPDDYISQTSEKIRLYKELDAMKTEKETEAFLASLQDRFGVPPEQVIQLSYVVRLRQLAISLGIEKVVLREGVMIIYFISDQNSVFYKTETFQNIMRNISIKRIGKVNYQQEKNKLSVKVLRIDSISKAYSVLLSLK